MIHVIIVDPSLDIRPSQAVDLTLSAPDSYLAGYDRMVSAIHAGQDMHVLVTDKVVSKWIKVMNRRYGPSAVIVEELTLRSQLQKQIGLEIPEYVKDQNIRESKLLDLNIPARADISFDDYLLEVFFGTFLTLPGGLRRVDELIANYEPDQWQAALKRPLVNQVFQKRVRETRRQLQKEERRAELQLLDWIEASPDVLIRNLFALRILSGYPEWLGEKLMGADVYNHMLRLRLDLHRVPIAITGNERVIDEIRLYLETQVAAAGDATLEALLPQISGCLEIEFDALLRLLTSGAASVTSDLIRRLRSKFQPIDASPRIAQALADLDLLITRKRPSDPDKAWEENEWSRWATEEYLPYRFWLEDTGRLDDDIAELAGTYADWLYASFGKLKYHSSSMSWKAMLSLKDEIAAHRGPVLVVVVDNLNAKFYPILQAQLRRRGYCEHHLSYCFSMLPSCTEVSKKCLMTGHYVPFDGSAYKKHVEECWAKRLSKRVLYVASIGELRSTSVRQHDVYFLNYLPVDIALHQNENDTGVSHAQALRGCLAALAEDIRTFARKIGAERDLMVIVASDHGSTRIPKGTVNVIQGKFYREHAEDEHHRYISLTDKSLSQLPENAKYDCYILGRETFELDASYLVARRLYRFLPTDENSYIHGGLTPEETLVPLAVYHPIMVSPKPLALTLVGASRIYVGTKFELAIEITNFNNYPCEQVTLEVTDPKIEAQPARLEALTQLKRLPISLSARCNLTAEVTSNKLHVRVSYKFLDQPYVDEVDLPVEIIEPAKPKFDLDNL